MNGRKLLFAALVAALSTDAAMAIDDTGWCAGVTGAPVIVCDDFDDYCPDPPCDDAVGDDSPDQAAVLAVWPRSEDNCLDVNLNPVNAVVVEEYTCGQWNIIDDCDLPSNWPSCVGTEFCGAHEPPSEVSTPFSLRQSEAQNPGEDYPDIGYPWNPENYIFYGTSHRHDLVPRIQELDEIPQMGWGSVNGTDDDPLVLEFVIDAYGDDTHRYGAAQVNRYIELTDGSDRAPAEIEYQQRVDNKWRPKVDLVDRETDHDVIAIGIFAVLDPDPCEPAFPRNQQPLTYRWSLYDGDRWIVLNANVLGTNNPSGEGGMRNGGHLNFITMTIKSSTIELASSCIKDGAPYSSTATAPRLYTGGFSTMYVGNGACLPSRKADYVDNIALTGGELGPVIPTGACCFGDGSCAEDATEAGCLNRLGGLYAGNGVDCVTANCLQPKGACCVNDPTGEGDFCVDAVEQATCEATLGGAYNGHFTACDDPGLLCCPDPFADMDGDQDVDQDDFAVFQGCMTNGPETLEPACKCLDQVSNGEIDQDDWDAFEACASGPDVPADETCDDPI